MSTFKANYYVRLDENYPIDYNGYPYRILEQPDCSTTRRINQYKSIESFYKK